MQKHNSARGIDRRQFLQQAGLAIGAAGVLGGCADTGQKHPSQAALGSNQHFTIVSDPEDPIASSPAGQWAVQQLCEAFESRGQKPHTVVRLQDAPDGPCIFAAGADSPVARGMLAGEKVALPQSPESLALIAGKYNNRPVLLACGRDARGLVYAMTELADRVRNSAQLTSSLNVSHPIVEQPTARVRGIMRSFTSDVEDKPWYNDREFWKPYLSMLASQRFNRFNLAFGIGYDFTRNIKDAYFYFAYPFLLSVPGYNVRATNLSDAERDNNLAMLKFISEETVARGLDFQLGIWTHAYKWTDSPDVNHNIEGLDESNHVNYCRDALKTLLQACPSISGVTFRIHGESGVAEGSYDFWKTLFDGIVQCGRKVSIDLHAKGIDQQMIDVALNTGMPVTVAPKTWAEHMGLPYHQAAIRPVEQPRPNRRDSGFFAKSSGSRSFLRYGYGDLFKEDRKYGIVHRTWPGTQRLLLWGDPHMAAAYATNFATFCGSDGLELMEPLSFKGRKGSGLKGRRDAYAHPPMQTRYDFEKYIDYYGFWGRLLFNPRSSREMSDTSEIIARASRILPLITTAHCPSAANNNYWPEIYTNMSIVDSRRPGPYSDTPTPRRFGTVSPLDPELFSTIDAHASDLLKGQPGCKYSPVEVARWLRQLADFKYSLNPGSRPWPAYDDDVSIQCCIGRFFASKFESGVLWSIFLSSGDRRAAEEAVKKYQEARECWSKIDAPARDYVPDITFGLEKQLRGQWRDRLPAIDADIAAMEAKLKDPPPAPKANVDPEKVAAAIAAVLEPPKRPVFEVTHHAPASFKSGEPIALDLKSSAASAHLHYRRVNQAEPWQVTAMPYSEGKFAATIPADYTQSAYPMQYYIELRNPAGAATIYPGLNENFTQQPYIVVRQARA